MVQSSRNFGQVRSVSDDFCRVSGFKTIGLNNIVEFTSGNQGIVMGYDDEIAEVLLFEGTQKIKEGELVKIDRDRLKAPTGPSLLGRIIDPLGRPLDERGAIDSSSDRSVEVPAKNIMERSQVDKQLRTGFLVIDSQIPVGYGQRELIVGQKQMGKSDLAAAIINNQTKQDTEVVSVYVGVGIQSGAMQRRINQLKSGGSIENSVVVVARSNQSSALNYIAPMTGMTIAEDFAKEGRNVLIVFDNLTRHARFYRQLALLAKRPSGREAYPGDIFYLHARLLERAGCFNKKVGGGSITALPIAETRGEEITDYITTNLMSITDGHILFRQELAYKNISPPIDSGFSVSRIGGRAQPEALRKFSGELKSIITQYHELEKYGGLGTELKEQALQNIKLGERFYLFSRQNNNEFFTRAEELALTYFITSQRILKWRDEQLEKLKEDFFDFIGKQEIQDKISKAFDSKEKAEQLLEDVFDKFEEDPESVDPEEKPELSKVEKETVTDVLHSKFKE